MISIFDLQAIEVNFIINVSFYISSSIKNLVLFSMRIRNFLSTIGHNNFHFPCNDVQYIQSTPFFAKNSTNKEIGRLFSRYGQIHVSVQKTKCFLFYFDNFIHF